MPLQHRVSMGSLKFQLHSRLESYINAQYDNSVPCTFNFALLMNDKFCNAAKSINTQNDIVNDNYEIIRNPS